MTSIEARRQTTTVSVLTIPANWIEALLERVGGRGRALDLACGTGQLARPLANHFATVDAIDQETDTIAFAAEKARRTGMDNVSWHIGRAEELDQVSAYDLSNT